MTILCHTYSWNRFSRKIYFMKKLSKKLSFFLNYGEHKIIIFWERYYPPFFRECVSLIQNGHFFLKNVGKICDKNSENYVLLWKNTFCKKWQSGRINFFWGGFSAFMVYALTLISDGFKYPVAFILYSKINATGYLNYELGSTKNLI